MRPLRFVLATAATLLLAACAGEPSAPADQVAADGDADVLSNALSSEFLEAQGPMGAAMGMGFGGGATGGTMLGVMGTGVGNGFGLGMGLGGMMGGQGGGMGMGGIGATNPGTVVISTMMPGRLDVQRTVTFFDAAGATQDRYDPLTTARVVTDEKMGGTMTMTTNGASRATTMETTRHSEVSGLAGQETSVTLNANGASKVTMTATRDAKTVTTTVNASDLTKDLVLAVPRTRGAYPRSGSVTHERTTTATNGTGTATHSYKEVMTFDGTATAKVTITVDGTTKNCTRALDTGRLTCP